jgi:hypothetical protein
MAVSAPVIVEIRQGCENLLDQLARYLRDACVAFGLDTSADLGLDRGEPGVSPEAALGVFGGKLFVIKYGEIVIVLLYTR